MKNGDFLGELEREVQEILLRNRDEVPTAERLKAIEMGAKLLMIRYRIEGTGEGDDGKFFGDRK